MKNTVENVDFKGYAPDIWCNPKTALSSVLAMLERYGLTGADTIAAIKTQLAPVFAQETSKLSN